MKANTILTWSLLALLCVGGACSGPKSSSRREPLGAANQLSRGGRSGAGDVDLLVRDAVTELEAGRLKAADRLLEFAVAVEPDNTKARYYLDLVKRAFDLSESNPDSVRFWYPTFPPRPVEP